MSWAAINAGMLCLPGEEEKFPQTSERSSVTEKSKLDQRREERLEAMLSIEVLFCYI